MSRRSTSASASNNLDALTNTELKELLSEAGFPNTPVTNSTRSVLIKRLRTQQEGGGGRGASKTRHTTGNSASYLARYSSAEEESDRESSKNRRGTTTTTSGAAATSQPTMPPPATTKRKRTTQQGAYSFFSPSSSSSVTYGSNNLPTIKVPIQNRSSVYIPPPAVHSSDTEESDSNTGGSKSNNTAARNPYLSYGRLSGLSFPKRYSPAPQDNNSPSVSVRSTSSYNNASPSSPASRLSDSHSGASSGGEDSPSYVSDFTKRLLQFRQEPGERRATTQAFALPPPNPRYFYRMPSRHTLVHQAAASTGDEHRRGNNSSISKNPLNWFRSLFHRLRGSDPASRTSSTADSVLDDQNVVPFVLVGAVVLFVAFLVFMYMTIRPDLVSTITLANAKYQPCSEDNALLLTNTPGENCIFESDLQPALDFLKLITPELQTRAQRHLCKDPLLPFILTASDATKIRLNTMHHDEYETQRQLANMEYLIAMNPQWHISNLNGDGIPLSITQLRQVHHANSFGILKPRLPLTCLFRRKLQTFFFVVGTLGMAATTAYFVNWLYKYRVQKRLDRQQKMNRLISQILQIVMEQAAAFPNNAEAAAVVLNHLRDKIIEPAQRTRQMEAMWREAIAFLEQNESRVQFEVGNRNGEECKVVRWVDTIQSPNHRSPSMLQNMQSGGMVANGGAPKVAPVVASVAVPNLYNSAQLSKVGEAMLSAKKWQSPAFDKSNKISAPPTPCLKIRQMFDKYEAVNPNLRTIISDAILEKVGPSCKIYDILLEPQACCVYVRCATAKDAGIVHDEINGWWFDNRLVSIKFLRLERFMDRFPESANSRNLMRPSNPQKLSLTQQSNRFADDDDDEEEEDLEEDEG